MPDVTGGFAGGTNANSPLSVIDLTNASFGEPKAIDSPMQTNPVVFGFLTELSVLNAGPVLAGTFGAIRKCPNEDFLNKCHIVQTRAVSGTFAEVASDWVRDIDLASIISAIAREFEVYNSGQASVLPNAPANLNDIDVVNGSGVTVVASETLPFDLNEGDFLTVDVDVSPEGDPTLDVTITLDFLPPCDDLVITLTGTRINVFGFIPQRDVTEELAFKTDIMKARNGLEQRSSFRTRPLVRYSYLYRLEDPERLAAMNKIMGSGDRLFSVPLWFDSEKLSADLSIGNTVVPVDTEFADYRDDGKSLLILWRAWNDFETAVIQSVAPTSVTLARPLEQNHAASETIVMPTRLVNISQDVSVQRYRRNLADLSIRWLSVESTDLDRMLSVPAQPTYQGLPLIVDPNYVSATISEPISQGFETVDSGGGGEVTRFRPASIVSAGSQKTWRGFSKEDRWNLRGLMHQLAGRRLAFYISTFAEDFIATAPLASGNPVLDYSPNEYTEQIANGDPRRDIEVVLKDGTALRRRIINSADDGETAAQLVVDANWGQNVFLDEIDRISLLTKVRLDSDTLSLSYTDTIETLVSTPIVEVLE